MKLVTFAREGGPPHIGLSDGSAIMDLTARTDGQLASWVSVFSGDQMAQVRQAHEKFTADVQLRDVQLLPVTPDAQKIFLVILNYETDRKLQKRPKLVYPHVMARFSDTLVGHGASILLPKVTREFDFEGELAVIIGRKGRYISRERALDYVAGYTCFNDFGARDFVCHSRLFTAGKNFPASAGIGPWIVTPDEFSYPSAAGLEVRLNGEPFQSGRVNDLTHPVDELISYISSFTTLWPGDVIATGSPDGAGHTRIPPRFLRAGDVVDVAIEGIGVLSNAIEAEPA